MKRRDPDAIIPSMPELLQRFRYAEWADPLDDLGIPEDTPPEDRWLYRSVHGFRRFREARVSWIKANANHLYLGELIDLRQTESAVRRELWREEARRGHERLAASKASPTERTENES